MDLIFSVNTSQIEKNIQSYNRLLDRLTYIGNQGFSYIRINLKTFSKRNCDRINILLNAINDVRDKFPQPVKVYVDIPFPYQKYRINVKDVHKSIKVGEIIGIHSQTSYENHHSKFWIQDDFFDDIFIGSQLVYADGEGVLNVLDIKENVFFAQAKNDFIIYNNKSLYNGKLQQQQFSNEFIKFIRDLCTFDIVKYLMFSFCDAGDYVDLFNSLLEKKSRKIYLAKIETIDGVKNIDSILQKYDGVIVARGDLAITGGINNFYSMHNYIAKRTKDHNKELYFATDIMHSLLKKNFPSRADIIDLSNMIEFKPNGLILKTDFAFYNRISLLKKHLMCFGKDV